jgi:hypothetical protein
LLHYFCKATEHNIAEAILWSYATVALGWICNDTKRWKTFVANHVSEIQTYTMPSQLKHCSGVDNRADYLSRGVTAERLKKLRAWWYVPSWLSQDPDHLPSHQVRTHHSLPNERTQSLRVVPKEPPGRLIESSRFSSYWRLLRTTAWFLRFVRHARRRRSSGEFDASELREARAHWIREVNVTASEQSFRPFRGGTPSHANRR